MKGPLSPAISTPRLCRMQRFVTRYLLGVGLESGTGIRWNRSLVSHTPHPWYHRAAAASLANSGAFGVSAWIQRGDSLLLVGEKLCSALLPVAGQESPHLALGWREQRSPAAAPRPARNPAPRRPAEEERWHGSGAVHGRCLAARQRGTRGR